jgi:dihydropteroate synthase
MFAWSELVAVRPAVMGIVNVTPDSFADGGRFLDPERAVDHAHEMVAAGADLVDVGGESTQPGAISVDEAEELRRVLPVVERLARELSVPVSVDTRKAAVAAAALRAGARIVNDVSAGRHDPAMLATVADAGAGIVAMHMRGEPPTMQDDPRYRDVTTEVGDFLAARIDAALDAGIARESVCADPGIGFGKLAEHNLALLSALPALRDRLDVPLMVGTSRKRFLGPDVEPDAREDATLATVVWSLDRGASVVRVHDVGHAVDARNLLVALAGAIA